MSFELMRYDLEDTTNALTDEERRSVAIQSPVIRLVGMAQIPVEHIAPNGKSFTVGDLERAIEKTERETRGSSNWLGGVDVHHVAFEGLHQAEEGTWEIYWGS